jgi:hypothetical protein
LPIDKLDPTKNLLSKTSLVSNGVFNKMQSSNTKLSNQLTMLSSASGSQNLTLGGALTSMTIDKSKSSFNQINSNLLNKTTSMLVKKNQLPNSQTKFDSDYTMRQTSELPQDLQRILSQVVNKPKPKPMTQEKTQNTQRKVELIENWPSQDSEEEDSI